MKNPLGISSEAKKEPQYRNADCWGSVIYREQERGTGEAKNQVKKAKTKEKERAPRFYRMKKKYMQTEAALFFLFSPKILRNIKDKKKI